MTTLTFTEYIEPKMSAAQKMMPAKAKADDGKTYTLPKAAIPLIENSLGTPLECETKTEQNGKYTNHFILSAKHVAAAAPVSAPIPTPVPAVEAVGRTQPAASVDARSNEINRQSARRDAVALVVAGIYPPDQLWTLIDALANYTYKTDPDSQQNNGPRTQAQHHLDDIREKVADIRAGYSDEDAVCPACGRREFLKQWSGGWFCARSKEAGVPGGCGHPEKGSRLDAPVSYGEWKTRTAATSVPWK